MSTSAPPNSTASSGISGAPYVMVFGPISHKVHPRFSHDPPPTRPDIGLSHLHSSIHSCSYEHTILLLRLLRIFRYPMHSSISKATERLSGFSRSPRYWAGQASALSKERDFWGLSMGDLTFPFLLWMLFRYSLFRTLVW